MDSAAVPNPRHVDFVIYADGSRGGFIGEANVLDGLILAQGGTFAGILDACMDSVLCYFDGIRIHRRPAPIEQVPCTRRIHYCDVS
jgi:hypothetical protein